MGVDIVGNAEVFTVRIYKRLVGRQDLEWANSYELRATASNADGPGALNDAVAALVGWEKNIHLSDVEYDRAVVSTYVPDGQPYDPTAFLSVPIVSTNGSRSLGGSQALPLQMCLLIRKQVAYGRNGRNLYRRCLIETEVAAFSGDPVLEGAAQAALQERVNDLVGDGDIFQTLGLAGFELVMASGVGVGVPTSVRKVSALVVAGVSIKPYNNRYYDRRSSPTPTP